MMITTIPETLHICNRCGELASRKCESCAEVRRLNEQLDEVWHARRAAEFYGGLLPGAAVERRSAGLYGSLPRITPPGSALPRRFRPPEWLFYLRGWMRVAAVALFDGALLLLALAAFWWVARAAIHELLG
jgi:hypothetical protein